MLTGLVSISVALTGFCPVGNVLHVLGFRPMLGDDRSQRWYFMQTDQWYLERRIYLAVGININIASLLVLFLTPRLMLFTAFVGGAMLVRRHRNRCHGERCLLARRRAATKSGSRALGPVSGMRAIRSLCWRTTSR